MELAGMGPVFTWSIFSSSILARAGLYSLYDLETVLDFAFVLEFLAVNSLLEPRAL
jgi:hypothetical protein